jgi:hypothetical protein
LTKKEVQQIEAPTHLAEKNQDDERRGNEALLSSASDHVCMTQIMREMAREETTKAIRHTIAQYPHQERHCVRVGDYRQNLAGPHFGGAQPDDTYYLSPITVFLFGLVDLSTSPNQMNCYTYGENEGNKGAHNVSSLLMHDMRPIGWIKEDEAGKSLTVIFDNCGGQNKNYVILRMTCPMHLVTVK